MPQARTIAEVIAGEAVHGTREQRYADMLGIASVISNRSMATGVPAESIVSAPDQFDAYGKSLPPGTSAYTGLAQQAWDQVQATGPVHPGTFYATPAKAKNLPKGLAPVTATTGHQYFVDPAARAIRTAVGYVKPSVDAVAGLVQNVAAGATNAIGGLLPDRAPAPAPRPAADVPRGLAALAPRGLPENSLATYNRANLTPSIGRVMDAVVGNPNSSSITVNSGYRDPARNARAKGAKRSQHLHGNAIDMNVRGLTDAQKQSVLDTAIEAGAKGIGLYSSGNTIHIDSRKTPATWRDNYQGINTYDGKPALSERELSTLPGWSQDSIRGMFGAGPFAVTPRTTAPTPFGPDQRDPNSLRPSTLNGTPPAEAYSQAAQSLGQAGVRGLGASQQFSAPVEKVDRAPLGPASLPPDRPMPSGPMASTNLGSLPPDRPMPSGPVNLGPSNAELAPAYGQMANTMGQVGVQGVGSKFGSIALGAPPSAPAVAPLQAPAPVQAPLQAPVQQPVNPPVAAPVRAPVQSPVQTMERLSPVNSFTAGDIYGGQVGSALASGGNTVSRDALGRTSVTNKHGVTTVSMPDGKQAATTSIGTASQGPTSVFGGMPAGLGGMVKGGLGAVAGAQLGGLLGPVGAVLGGYVGSQLAQGKNPLGALTNQGTGKGLGYFPSAPKGNKVSASFSNRSERGMRDISPAAADAIGRGRAGLY